MEVKKKILQHIDQHKNEIVEFLRSLIRIPSVTGSEKEISNFIAKKLDSLGLEVDVWEPNLNELKKHPGYVSVEMDYKDRPNVVGVWKGAGGGKSLLFNGHLDVINADPSVWKHNPWGGEIENGQLYGRGASDMKSGLAAMTMALACIIEVGIRLKGDVILEYVVDEEFTGHGTLDCILRNYKADAGVSCEASDLEVQPAATGSMWFEIKVDGKSASMSRIWEAVSAIEKGHVVHKAIQDYQTVRFEKRHPLYPDPKGALACFAGIFQAGSYPSSPPDTCTIKGRMGVLPNEDPADVKREFIEYIENAAKKDPWLREHLPRVEFTGYYAEPAEIPADHPICTTVISSFEEATMKKPVVRGHEGAADTRFLIKYGATPTVIFGPGTITQMHATDEWVRIEDLITSVKVLALTILNWCGWE
ncbi:ArgE/DapE family deacylase [Candidatus Hecatella orcuttiae]|jgi:acetylornithine deacetylase|uniref:ArgE/DapE family deacylase n=1 Tax=Candidatus Hecatella orcuttiae TaxID=1935119 RepID=UPI002867DA65|nr:ArgE/DapE family deacylase [Candidatus Hecatella orcuttiae]